MRSGSVDVEFWTHAVNSLNPATRASLGFVGSIKSFPSLNMAVTYMAISIIPFRFPTMLTPLRG